MSVMLVGVKEKRDRARQGPGVFDVIKFFGLSLWVLEKHVSLALMASRYPAFLEG